MNSLKIFTICPADHLKAGKIGVTKAVSTLYAILCFLKFGLMKFILSSGTKKGTNMFDGPPNNRKFH